MILETLMGKNENLSQDKAIEIILKRFRQINNWISALKLLSIMHIILPKIMKNISNAISFLGKPSFPNLHCSKNDDKSLSLLFFIRKLNPCFKGVMSIADWSKNIPLTSHFTFETIWKFTTLWKAKLIFWCLSQRTNSVKWISSIKI